MPSWKVAKKYRVRLSLQTEQDALAIRDYIAHDKISASKKWWRNLWSKIRSLNHFPEKYEIIPEAADVGINYRHIVFGNYRIIFLVLERDVYVVRIVHAAQDYHPSLFAADEPD